MGHTKKSKKKQNNEFTGYEIVCIKFFSIYVEFHKYWYGVEDNTTYSYYPVHNSQMVFNVWKK